jgi:hypothetical protein
MSDLAITARLLVFTRYPEPGKTKTRLIPLLGAEQAANLQRQLTEYTLAQVEQLQRIQRISTVIYYAGGDRSLMTQWLGSQWDLRSQQAGDLGARMAGAFQDAFAENMKKVVIIGIDCPDLTSEILQKAFLSLDHRDCVLGEAIDGGYYLLGMGQFYPALFDAMPWGSDRVFALTRQRMVQMGGSVGLLPRLRDLDRPEDLEIWQTEIL